MMVSIRADAAAWKILPNLVGQLAVNVKYLKNKLGLGEMARAPRVRFLTEREGAHPNHGEEPRPCLGSVLGDTHQALLVGRRARWVARTGTRTLSSSTRCTGFCDPDSRRTR